MNLDLLVKLISVPTLLVLVNMVTGTKSDMSMSELAVSVQYEALRRGLAETTYAESFFDPTDEEGLESSSQNASYLVMPVSYFDANLVQPSFLAQITGQDQYSLFREEYAEGIDGYINVLVAGGQAIEEEAGFFENALWGELNSLTGSDFSGLSGFGLAEAPQQSQQRACPVYSPIQRAQEALAQEFSPEKLSSTLTAQEVAAGGTRLAGEETGSTAIAKGAAANVADLVDTAMSLDNADPETLAMDDCFLAQARSVLAIDPAYMTPLKQMPQLAYYDYFFTKSGRTIDIDGASANFFGRVAASSADPEKRERLLELARESQDKWNAFRR